jgi:hypothetical protein
MAEDAAAMLDGGAAPDAVLPSRGTELANSLQTFVMVFDNADALVASSATLHGQAPPFPSSVMSNMRGAQAQDRITWQPEAGVRSAVIVQAWQGGFVVVGRSLRLVEEREQNALELTTLVWAMSMAATGIAALGAAALLI